MRVALAILLFATAPLDIQRQTRNIILVNGQPIGAVGAINLAQGTAPGCGIVWSVTPNPAQNRTDVTASMNSACSPTIAQVHAGLNYCESANATVFYSCALAVQPLTALARGVEVTLVVDTDCATSCSLDAGTGPNNIKLSDGSTDPNGAIVHGQAKRLWFDGTVWRIE